MALFAASAELAAVQVRMAVRALRAYVAEHQINMTAAAVHLFVQAAQGIGSPVVAEFRLAANRFPTGEGMATVTGL